MAYKLVKAQKTMYLGIMIGMIYILMNITIIQYGLDEPALCWECYLDWDKYWERFWVTLPAFIACLPLFGIYLYLYYTWARKD